MLFLAPSIPTTFARIGLSVLLDKGGDTARIEHHGRDAVRGVLLDLQVSLVAIRPVEVVVSCLVVC